MKRILGYFYNLIKKQSSMKCITSLTLGLLVCLILMTSCGGQSSDDEGNGNNVIQNNQATPAPISTPSPTPPPQQNIEAQQPLPQGILNNRWVFVDIIVNDPEVTRAELLDEVEGLEEAFGNLWIVTTPDGTLRSILRHTDSPPWVMENVVWAVESGITFFDDWDGVLMTKLAHSDEGILTFIDGVGDMVLTPASNALK